jgi:hypothetical protein
MVCPGLPERIQQVQEPKPAAASPIARAVMRPANASLVNCVDAWDVRAKWRGPAGGQPTGKRPGVATDG